MEHRIQSYSSIFGMGSLPFSFLKWSMSHWKYVFKWIPSLPQWWIFLFSTIKFLAPSTSFLEGNVSFGLRTYQWPHHTIYKVGHGLHEAMKHPSEYLLPFFQTFLISSAACTPDQHNFMYPLRTEYILQYVLCTHVYLASSNYSCYNIATALDNMKYTSKGQWVMVIQLPKGEADRG